MTGQIASAIVGAALLILPFELQAQSVDAKLAGLEKLAPLESQLLEGQDVRMPDIFDIGKRYQVIGNRYREIFPGAR